MSGERIEANTLNASHLQAGSMGTLLAAIDMAYVGGAHIQAAAIGTAHIQAAVIDSAHLKNASITNAKIKDAEIKGAKIKDGEITNAKIADAAITSAKIGLAEIDTLRIAGNAVTVHASAFTPGGFYPPSHVWLWVAITLPEPAFITIIGNIGESDDDYWDGVYLETDSYGYVDQFHHEYSEEESVCLYRIAINNVTQTIKKQYSFAHASHGESDTLYFDYVFPPTTVLHQKLLAAGTHFIDLQIADLSNKNNNGWKYYVVVKF